MMSDVSRREFLAAAACGAGLLATMQIGIGAEPPLPLRWPVCVFVKFLQSMSFEDLSAAVANLGFQGIEATVRKGGQISPDQATEKLPQLVEALKKHHLDVTIMASSVNRADDPLGESVLRLASQLGIKRYRMDYYKYDLSRPVAQQLNDLKPIVKDLAALNKELGLQAIYQNHAGPGFVGSSIWDLHFLLEEIPREQIGIAYDTRHSTVEAGMSWPVLWNLVQPHLAAVYVKNARWTGRTPHDLPLAEAGTVDPKIFSMLEKSDFQGPISLHVEYLEKGSVEENLAAIRRDFKTLRGYLDR